MIQNWKFQRGDIFFTRFDNATGSEQSGNRPAVVLQNDVGNFYSPTLIVATLTSKAAKKYTQPTHCLLVNDFLSVPSIVQAEQIFTIDKSRVLKFLGHLTPEEMSRVDDAVRASLALNPMGSIQRLPPIIRSTAAYAPPEVVDGKPPIYPYTPIKSSFEDAGSVEDMMLYTELEAAVHAMIQRLEYSFTFNPSLLTIPKRKQQVTEILEEAEKYIWRIKEEIYCEALRHIVAAWEGRPDSFRAAVLRGVMYFVQLYHGQYSAERLVRALSGVHPMELYRISRDNPAKLPGWRRYVYPIYTTYNGKCRKDALPMKF